MNRLLRPAVLLVLLFSSVFAVADTPLELQAVPPLLKQGKYDVANRLLDKILKKDPKTVDALMYKGNILYQQASRSGMITMYGNDDENIYDNSIGSLGAGPSTISKEEGREIASWFLKALAIDPQRMDIQLGLCWTYANAGMTRELIGRFDTLKRYARADAGIQYNMGDYARIIADEYSFDDGLKVYQEIMRLYPQDGNIVNDIGALHFMRGRLQQSIPYFKRAADKKHKDAKTLANLVLIYSILGNYDAAARFADQRSALEKNKEHLLYRALNKRLHQDKTWTRDVKGYIDTKSPAYADFAKALLTLQTNPSFDAFQATRKAKADTIDLIPHFEWAARQYPDRFEAVYALAELMTYYQNHDKAIALYQAIIKGKLARDTKQKENLDMFMAWSLYKQGKAQQANGYWQPLLYSGDFFKKSAASYFLGNYYYKRKEYAQARKYFARVKDDASKSKYANFCSNLYRAIESK